MVKKIYNYNVNGIRAAINKGFLEWLKEESPDIVCIQETKAQKEQLNTFVFDEMGYKNYWYSAQKKGYSGVMILTKDEPDTIKAGIGMPIYDTEGRFLRVDYGDISVISTYFPSGTSGDERQAFKMQWLEDFTNYIIELRKERPNLIISGDMNICHKAIDINHPERHQNSSGFLPEERDWFDHFIEIGFVDTFREFNDQPEQYSWWSYRANSRTKNLGWRIDYHLITESLKPRLKNVGILPNAFHSDHCPVTVEIDF